MQIKFTGKYKSLKDFTSDELTDFCIVTGKNGVGKTQLIEAIKMKLDNSNPIPETRYFGIELIPEVKKIQFEGLNNISAKVIGRQLWHDKVFAYFNEFRNMPRERKLLIDEIIANGITSQDFPLHTFDVKKFLSPKDNMLVFVNQLLQQWNVQVQMNVPSITIQQRTDILLQSLSANIFSIRKLIIVGRFVAAYKKKLFSDLEENDFTSAPYDETEIENPELFNIQVAGLFYNYAKQRYLNDHSYFQQQVYKANNDAISDIEFTEKFPPPWETVNKILTQYKIKYKVPDIPKVDFSDNYNYSFHLIKISNDDVVDFSDLSSGEQIIVGLILKLFLSDSYFSKLEFPDLLILDEPDAHLHPEMSHLLIKVLNETFVQKLKVKVFFTTHDPSTIALAPDDCIFEMKNDPLCELKKISRDDALNLLTQNLPTLSIDYKNHRQVFVEAPNDVRYYQYLFDKYFPESSHKRRLYFISNAAGDGNCEQVIDIVAKLRTYGIASCYGIIDWDIKNRSKLGEGVFVHGENSRYSIENFLLDPSYLVAFFITQNNGNNVEKELRFSVPYNQYNIGEESPQRLQQISNWVFEKVELKFPALKANKEKTEIKYKNGKTVLAPLWFTTTQGHYLIGRFIETFPSLQRYDKTNNDLLEQLTIIMAKCYPFVAVESIDILDSISG